MKYSADLTTSLASPLEALGFTTGLAGAQGDSAQGGTAAAQNQQVVDQASSLTEGWFNIDQTLFYNDIVSNEFAQPLPNKSIDEAFREMLVPTSRITQNRNNRGVRGISFGGSFYYTPNQGRTEAREFLESWHKFCLFGPKRRPWTKREAELVGEGTTTDGEFAPNKVRLWCLLPAEGTGPKNLADLSQVTSRTNGS